MYGRLRHLLGNYMAPSVELSTSFIYGAQQAKTLMFKTLLKIQVTNTFNNFNKSSLMSKTLIILNIF